MSLSQPGRITRRQFLTGLGATLAYAGATLACGQGEQLATRVSTSPASTSAPPPASGGAADMVLWNGKIITVDAGDSIAQAIAIRNGLVQAVGTNDKIRALAGGQTRLVDLKGKAVTPGLIDPHNHLQVMGMTQSFFTPFMPPEVKTLDDLKKKVAEALAKKPKGEWLQGYFLGVTEGRLPNRQDLDPVSPNHPVWIMQQGGHYGSANSLALKLANIMASTPSPEGGLIEKDAKGEPTGVFYNHRAMDVLRRVAPQQSAEEARKNITLSLPMFAACGVTTFHDNNVRGVDGIARYLDVGRQGQMTLRCAVYYTLEWPQDLDRALKEVERYDDGKFVRMAGYKFLIDGQPMMAYCHQPHNGLRWNQPTWEPKSFKQTVRALHDSGLQICVHCIGDAAVDLTLDAYEEAMKANPRPDPRHRIEHVVLTTPDATRRMKDLGVIASINPTFVRLSADYWATVFNPAQMKRVMMVREWLKAGVHVTVGSDAPTVPWYTPQATLAAAISRLTASNKVQDADQRMTIQEALRAHTLEAAFAGHEEKIKGSLEAGKLADLAVWNQDPYTASVQQLWDAKMAMTIVGGQIVYSS